MRSLVVCICLLSQISFAQKTDSTKAFHIALGTEICFVFYYYLCS